MERGASTGMQDQQTDSMSKPTDIASVFRQYSPFLLRYLSSRLGSEAEAHDLAQEAYLRLLRVPDLEIIEKPEAYLFRISANLANEFLLKRAKSGDTVDFDGLEDTGGISDEAQFEQQIEVRSSVRRLDSILDTLPPLYRTVLLMRKRDGYSHREIAERLKISTHRVHRCLKKALAKCRSEWPET